MGADGPARPTASIGTTYHRSARLHPPVVPPDEIVVAAPPVEAGRRGGIVQLIIPCLGGASMLVFALVYKNRLFLIVAGVLAVISVVAAVAMFLEQGRLSRRERRLQRDRYRAHLADRERHLASVAAVQRARLARLHPDPAALWAAVVERDHLWERRREDADFAHVRIGRGPVPLAAPIRLQVDDSPLVAYEPDLLADARSLVARYQILPHDPVVIDVVGSGTLAVSGDRARARGLVRSLLLRLAADHAPDDLRIVAHLKTGDEGAWEWLKWLPHTRQGWTARPAAVAADLTVDTRALARLLDDIARPRLEQLARDRAAALGAAGAPAFQHVVVVIDGYDPTGPLGHLVALETLFVNGPELRVTVICLVDEEAHLPSAVGARLHVSPSGRLSFEDTAPGGQRISDVVADHADVKMCDAVARSIAPLRLANRRGRTSTLESDRLFDLLGVDAATVGAALGQPRPRGDLLRVPFGVRDDGQPVELDLKESAEGGMGPHGLVIGATGSGKSELLRTLVTALALTHSPEQLTFVFADFKGGAAFAELARLPHTAGMITNLQRDLTMVDRMRDALFGEQERRQRLLQDAGNLDDIRQYQTRRTADPDAGLEPMPYLLLVVDEFGELLTSRPDFLDLFLTIARTGRSLGMHLLLSSQRLDEGRIRSLEGHLRYRICLRTFSPEESQAVLGTRDAFLLPPLPGLGFLKVDERVQRFKTAMVTAPYREPTLLDQAPAVQRFDSVLADEAEEDQDEGPGLEFVELLPEAPSEMEVAIRALSQSGAARAHQVWLPPLPRAVALDRFLGATGPDQRWLSVPVGLLDRPRDQTQEPFVLDLGGAGGHLAVVGAPRTGKSTFLRTVIGAFGLTHRPDDVQFYVIDLGGGTLHELEGLPHVGAVCGRADRERIERTVRELRALVDERAATFRRRGIAGMVDYHDLRRRGELPEARYGEVFLVIDNWALLRQELEELEPQVTELALTGLHYGVHVVLATGRWADLRPALRDAVGTRIELRLNDALESDIGRHAAEAVPERTPGRGICAPGLQFHAALPRIDHVDDDVGHAKALDQLVAAASRWNAPGAPPVRLLPLLVTRADLPEPDKDDAPGVAIGLEEFGLAPLRLDLFGGEPHFLVFGDAEAGKTNTLRQLLRGIGERYDPADVRVAIVDPRRGLLDMADGAHIGAVAWSTAQVAELASDLVAELTGRLPARDLTRAELLERRWWQGPEIVLVVDDYDLVASGMSNPLAPLVDLLAQGRDIGFHAVVARRVGGSARSSFEPFFQRLRELGSPGLILSGDPTEGPLLADQKAAALPRGRGFLVRRGMPTTLVQVALDPPLPDEGTITP